MSFSRIVASSQLSVFCIAVAFASLGCKKANNNNNGVAGTSALTGTGTGGVGVAGTGVATAGTGTAGVPVGTAGTQATAGTSAAAGTGATAGTGAAGTGATAGTSAAAGTGAAGTGASGAGGSPMDAGTVDPTVTACISGLMAAGKTVGDCETCLCQVGNCQNELMALKGDDKGNALVDCAKAHMCSGACCLCGTSTVGANCMSDFSDFGMGPCGNEVQTAAGDTPMTGTSGAIANSNVATACDPTPDAGMPMNSCHHATALAKCESDHCKDKCNPPVCKDAGM